MAYRVSKERFGELVEEALGEVPEPFATHLEEVSIEIRDLPTGKQARQSGVYKTVFAKQHGMTVKTLDSLLDRVAKRKHRSDK